MGTIIYDDATSLLWCNLKRVNLSTLEYLNNFMKLSQMIQNTQHIVSFMISQKGTGLYPKSYTDNSENAGWFKQNYQNNKCLKKIYHLSAYSGQKSCHDVPVKTALRQIRITRNGITEYAMYWKNSNIYVNFVFAIQDNVFICNVT